ncbi:MAG: EpsG family protein [Prevotella sp.]|nr:EpsG family protein [Prevotella sp.]
MLESIIVYFGLTFIMMICGWVASNRYKLAQAKHYKNKSGWSVILQPEILVAIFAFTIVFGCRWNVGVDYPHYLYRYLTGIGSERHELLFGLISEWMRDNGFHFSVYFSLWAFIQIFLLYYSFRKYRYLFPYIAFYLIVGYTYMGMMNIIRQQLAACIFMMALQFVDEKKLIKYLLCVFVAFLFHKSALLLLIFYPIFLYKKDFFPSIKLQLLAYLLFMVFNVTVSQYFIQIIETPFGLFTELLGFDNYSYGILNRERLNSIAQFGNDSTLSLIYNAMATIPIIIYSTKLKKYYNSSYFNIIYSLWFVKIMAEFLTGDSIILNRPFVYLVNYKMIMFSFFTYYCFKNKNMYFHLLGLFFILWHIAKFLLMLSNGELNTSKFTFFWEVL